jgi:hypothetical protein
LLESNPWRRLTISEHRGHLLPDAEDISCRGAPTVGLHAEMRQRIYRPSKIVTCSPAFAHALGDLQRWRDAEAHRHPRSTLLIDGLR